MLSLLPFETQAAFDTLAAALRADLLPQGGHESFLVDLMIEARWRIARINHLEAAALEAALDPETAQTKPEARILALFAKSKNTGVLSVL